MNTRVRTALCILVAWLFACLPTWAYFALLCWLDSGPDHPEFRSLKRVLWWGTATVGGLIALGTTFLVAYFAANLTHYFTRTFYKE